MTVYLITHSIRASDISGAGAALYPGRWNIKGIPVLYTGESKEIALLEIPNSTSELDIKDLPSNWVQFPAPTILSEMAQEWVDEGTTVALKVPSCVVYSSHNFALNCSHPDYRFVKITDQRNFGFDSRLTK